MMNYENLTIALLIGLFILTIFNTYQINTMLTGNVVNTILNNNAKPSTVNVIPSGVPEVYGLELNVSYDDVNPSNPQLADKTIRKLALYEDLNLTEDQMKRYISIASNIACEYCCGARALIFSNGDRACGCAHSSAMRGLAKYLIVNHPDMTDNSILEELGKWKTLFFPTQIIRKAQILQDKGIELNYINLASNKYRGIEKEISGGMVGGC